MKVRFGKINIVTKYSKLEVIFWTILFFVILYILLSVTLAKSYRNKVLPEYYFLGAPLNHVSKEDLQPTINSYLNTVDQIVFIRPVYKNLQSESFILSTTGQLSLDSKTYDNIEKYFFDGSWLESYKIIFGFFKKKVDLGEEFLVVDEAGLRDAYLKKDSKVAVRDGGSASLDLTNKGELGIREEIPEIDDDLTSLRKIFFATLKNGEFTKPIYIVNLHEPEVTTVMWQNFIPQVRNLIGSNSILNFNYANNNFVISPSKVPTILSIHNKQLVVDAHKLSEALHQSPIAKFEVKPSEPLFIYDKENLRVLSFKKEEAGKKFETENLAKNLSAELLTNPNTTKNIYKNLQLTTWQSEKKLSDVNPFGISDLLGTGYSSMRNSASERYANITNGINKLDGVLVAPGEEFSTIGKLAPFTIENGYVEGLAIKKNKILPEVGGGMCQVSTTLFRAAMNSGLKITDRSNHSVVVNYYDDPRNGLPGTDATIYEPAPDFKFVNDTKNYLLIDTRVEAGGQIYFDFWGTKDGRSGYFSPPQVLSRTESTSEPVYDLSSSVPTGQVRCSGPFNGMSTVFTYFRTLSDGRVEKVPYYSYYRPQGQNCLVGM